MGKPPHLEEVRWLSRVTYSTLTLGVYMGLSHIIIVSHAPSFGSIFGRWRAAFGGGYFAFPLVLYLIFCILVTKCDLDSFTHSCYGTTLSSFCSINYLAGIEGCSVVDLYYVKMHIFLFFLIHVSM